MDKDKIANLIKANLAILIVLAYYIVSSIIIRVIAGDTVFAQLATITSYINLFLIVIIAYKFVNFALQMVESEVKQSKKKSSSQEEDDVKKVNITVNTEDAKLYNIERSKKVKDTLREESDDIREWLNYSYVILQSLVIAIFIVVSLIRYPIINRVDSAGELSLFHTISFLIMAMVAFVLRKWIVLKGDEKERDTLYSLLMMFEILLFISSAIVLLNVIFSFSILYIMTWLYWAAFVYGLVMIVMSYIKALIAKKSSLDFNYNIIPIINKSDGGSGFVETLEKNTGLSIKSLWSFKYIASLLPIVVIGISLVMLMSTCIYRVEAHQEGAVYRFGALRAETAQPGLNFKLPWPIDSVEIYDVNRIQDMQIGFADTRTMDNLWTVRHDGGEYSLLLGDGNELVSVNIKLTYYINDLHMYITNHSDPESMLYARAYEIMLRRTNDKDLDTILRIDRSALANNILIELNEYADEMFLGIQVNDVIVKGIHPPVEIASVYQYIISTYIDQNTLLTNALTEAYEKLVDAEKQSSVSIIDAEARQIDKVSDAEYEVAVYHAIYQAYLVNPDCFTLSKYISTYEKVIDGSKVYVFSINLDEDLSDFIIGYEG